VLPGAIWANLVPTVIALAVYFCFADFVLISQCLYYNHINARRARKPSTASTESEHSPLLTRRRSSALNADHPIKDPGQEELESAGNPWVRNTLSILGVIAAGTAGWAIAWQSGVWKPTPEHRGLVDGQDVAVGAQVLGYLSAIFYLGSVSHVTFLPCPLLLLTMRLQRPNPPDREELPREILRG
jgi:hypothetical protein